MADEAAEGAAGAGARPSALDVSEEGGRTVVRPSGDWLARTLNGVDAELRGLARDVDPSAVAIDLTALGRIDTAGAFVLGRVLGPLAGEDSRYIGEHPTARRLIALTRERAVERKPARRGPGILDLFERAGRGLASIALDGVETLAFFGETLEAAGRALARPDRIRWPAVFHVMEQAGVNALPVIGSLSFFIGAVVAYLGANTLAQFGASVLGVEAVSISILREFGVVITAIMLAGRSDSAFTAQIGAMRMQQEVDAMRALGLDPFDVLVLPRVIACLVMTPILTFAAMMMGLLGGMLVLWSSLDITPGFFIARMHETVPLSHFWVGLSKAPVFALVIAIVGCRQGLSVGGDVESLGRKVTASVVQAIFAVIVIDAVFDLVYYQVGI